MGRKPSSPVTHHYTREQSLDREDNVFKESVDVKMADNGMMVAVTGKLRSQSMVHPSRLSAVSGRPMKSITI
jgi:hypothetical protein